MNGFWFLFCGFRKRLIPALSALIVAAACTQVPELDATIPDHLRKAPYPELVPLDGSLATVQQPQDQAAEIEQSLAARRDRLQSQAKALNTPIVDPAARERMQNGVNR